MIKQTFPLWKLVQISTGILLFEDDAMDAVYEVMNFMTQQDLSTASLPSAMNESRPWLLQQCPFLANINLLTKQPKEYYTEAIKAAVAKYGDEHTIAPIPADDIQRHNPFEDAYDINPNIKTLGFNTDTGDVSSVEIDEDGNTISTPLTEE